MKTKGFTLVELLVVIAILAILATVSVVGYTSFIENANKSAAQQELIQVRDKVIADDILNNNVKVVDGSIVMTIAKDTSVTDADKAKEAVVAYLKGLADDLDGDITVSATTVENKDVTDNTKVVSYTVTVSEVKYKKDAGEATWTLSTGKVE